MPHLFLTILTAQKLLKQLLAFLNLYQHAKNQFIPSSRSWDTVNLLILEIQSCDQIMPIQKFWSTFNFCGFVSTCKTPCYFIHLLWRYSFLFLSGKYHLYIMKYEWMGAFWPISQEDFSQIWNSHRTTANKINFHYGLNSVKNNDQIISIN